MKIYQHPSLPDFISPAPFKLGESDEAISYARGWWSKAMEQEIAALGFVEYVLLEPEPPTFTDLKVSKLAALAERRWQFEVSGFVWQRPETSEIYYIATDEVSQGKMGNERKAAEGGIRRPGDVWKCGDPATGNVVYVPFTDAEIIAMSNDARHRTSDGFNHEAVLAAAINAAGDQAELDLVDINAGWPA